MERNRQKRETNIELLRIIAMFLVLIVHSDFFSLGAPSKDDICTNFTDSLLRIFFQSLSIACVDIFVFISGWFGIKPKIKGLCNYLFQCLFFLIGIYTVCLVTGITSLSIMGIRGCIAATPLNWFIKAYLLLYVLSPVLNAFIDNASRRQFKSVLVAFYLFQFTYGWAFSSSTSFIQDGYSTISFVGLYLLARYLKLYRPFITNFKWRTDLIIVFSLVVGTTALYLIFPEIGNRFLNYISPTTILISIFAILAFSKFSINSKFINWCAASSFAVFLLHTNPNVIWHFQAMCVRLHNLLSPLCYWGGLLIILATIFVLAIAIDQLRISIWKMLWCFIEQKCNKHNSI